jgi:hypothetical protein
MRKVAARSAMTTPIRHDRGSRSVRSRYTPREIESKLVRYLTAGQGHAVITGDDQYEVRRTLDAAVDRVPEVRVIAFSGRLGRIDVMAELMAGSRKTRHDSGPASVENLFQEMAEARSRGVALVVVVEDADLASVQSLESLRMACEAFASKTISVRIVLLGGGFLDELLAHPVLEALQSRVSSRFCV